MKKFIIAILSLFTLFACTNNPQFEESLNKVSSIIRNDADSVFAVVDSTSAEVKNMPEKLQMRYLSAYAILDSLSSEINDVPEKLQMRYRILYVDVLNKLGEPLPSDTVFMEVVNYYDQHGTPNEQLKAHYLLGCIYREMLFEAPIALQCYYDAVEKVDTLSEDCDFGTLCSTWGQIAEILHIQHMPDLGLQAWGNYSKYALKNGDVYNYLRGKDFSTMAYIQKGDTATVIDMTHELFRLYMENGFEQDAYGVYPLYIDILLVRGQYAEARRYMDLYETKSGVFDENREIIAPGRELYYQTKGIYYLGVHNLDSAEINYRKLLEYETEKYPAYKGLAEVYCQRGIVDSVVEFTRLQEDALYEYLDQVQIDAAQQASSMYNYSRVQRLADEKRAEAKLNALLLTFAVFVFIVIVVAMYFLHKKYMAAKEDELVTLNDTYEKTKTEYVQAVENLTEQTEEYEQFKKEKLDEVENLKSKYNDLKSKDDEAALLNTPFINGIRDILKPLSPKPCMTNSDIEELLLVVREYLPHFFMEIAKDDRLSQQELLVCILLRLNFSGKDLSVLLNTSSSSIANAKKRANEKLFGMSQANMLITNLKNLGAE